MVDSKNLEIDVDELMKELTESLARREAEGNCSLSGVTGLSELLLTAREAAAQQVDRFTFKLQPDLARRSDEHYHVDDLLQFHDHAFVWNSYLAILKREPDEWGLKRHLERLRSGRVNRIDLLASLRFSSEGRSRGVRITGLLWPAMFRRLFRIPVLGYLLETVTLIARLPEVVREQRQFEGHVISKLELLTNHINSLVASSLQPGFQPPQQPEAITRLIRAKEEIEVRLGKSQGRKTESTP